VQGSRFYAGNGSGCKSGSWAAAFQKLLRKKDDFAVLLAGFQTGTGSRAVF